MDIQKARGEMERIRYISPHKFNEVNDKYLNADYSYLCNHEWILAPANLTMTIQLFRHIISTFQYILY